MLHGVHPALSGDLLRELDHLGHGDALLVADANYPAYSMGAPVIDIALNAPDALEVIRSVIPVDTYDAPSVHLMRAEPGVDTDVQDELRAAAACGNSLTELLDRHDFYAYARSSRLVVRTTETRPYANLLMRKGVVTAQTEVRPA